MVKLPKKFVVYTVVVGNYDDIHQPLYVDDRFDYVLFSVDIELDRVGVWEVRKFNYFNKDYTRMSRYPKMHPEELLSEYAASLYMDANVQINEPWVYERVVQFYAEGVEWGGVSLMGDDLYGYGDLYGHIQYITLEGWESRWKGVKWGHFLRAQNFPRQFDCFENNLIYRRNTEVVKEIDDMWWHYYESYSRRDQFSLPFLMWKHPHLKTGYILPLGQHVWNSEFVTSYSHCKTEFTRKTHAPYRTFRGIAQMNLMRRYPSCKKRLNDFFYSICNRKTIIAFLMVETISWLILAIYGPIIYYKEKMIK